MADDYPIAPWISEADERDRGVLLVYRDDEIKQTVRRDGISGSRWYVIDWELTEFDGRKVWTSAWTFSIEQPLLDAIAKLPGCEHTWIDATNKVVSGTDLCPKCGALRAKP